MTSSGFEPVTFRLRLVYWSEVSSGLMVKTTHSEDSRLITLSTFSFVVTSFKRRQPNFDKCSLCLFHAPKGDKAVRSAVPLHHLALLRHKAQPAPTLSSPWRDLHEEWTRNCLSTVRHTAMRDTFSVSFRGPEAVAAILHSHNPMFACALGPQSHRDL
jgi:hypothetical protein